MPYQRIVFTHDVFRVKARPKEDLSVNIHLLRTLLTPALRHAKLPIEEALSSQFGGTVHTGLLRRDWETPPASGSWEEWVRAYSLRNFPESLERYLQEVYSHSLVVGFEIPVSLMRFFRRNRIPFLDVSIDPVRFTADNFFRVRTNDPDIEAVLKNFHVPAAEIETYVANIAVALTQKSRASNPDSSKTLAVFAGQTPLDSSLISDGKLATLDQHLEAIGNAFSGVDQILLKPHPYGTAEATAKFLQAFPEARLCTVNPYEMLLWPNLKKVVALSSGLLKEAEFFGVESVCIAPPENCEERLMAEGFSRDYRIGIDFATQEFWRQLLHCEPDANTSCPSRRHEANALLQPLRKCFGAWSAALIYSGIEPAGTTAPALDLPASLNFDAGGNAGAYLGGGFSQPEELGTWSDGPQALLHFSSGPANGDVELRLKAIPFTSRLIPAQKVTLRFNGLLLAQPILSKKGEIHIVIPCERWNRAEKKEFEFFFPNAHSPMEAGVNGDSRQLGWFFRSLELTVKG